MAHCKVEQKSDETQVESSYSARMTYLHGMKAFMADITGMYKSFPDEHIEEYLLYEKKLSDDIQKMLEQCE